VQHSKECYNVDVLVTKFIFTHSHHRFTIILFILCLFREDI
jgi:hypothetical protein